MGSRVDLSQLAIDRTEAKPRITLPRGRLLIRYVLPAAIMFSFVGLFAWAARDSLLPAQAVTVAPVLVSRAEVQNAGTPLFQAAGWIEPRPTPVVVSSLAAGVMEELHVVAGDDVAKGQPLAKLIDTDAKIALRESEANLQLREAEVAMARAALTAARTNLEKPVQLKAVLADAESALARIEREIANLPFAIQAAEARVLVARQNVEAKVIAGDAVAGRLLRQARGELATAEAGLAELNAGTPTLEQERLALTRKRDALRERLALKTDETRQLAEAQAQLEAATAQVRQATLAIETAKLRLERMIVRSPIDGRVLTIEAQPGTRLMGLDLTSERGASAVVTLYDPASLQVRVDVRLEDVPQVTVGQSVHIETASAPDGLKGRVLSVTSVADIQKNTLQIKAAISSPPDVVRPEMLAQVKFIAPESPADKSEGSEDSLKMLVPRHLVSAGEGVSCVWIADQDSGVARKRSVTLGRAGTDELVEVVDGLTPLDKLIVGGREALVDGQRIRVTAEDGTLGLASIPLAASRDLTRTARKTETQQTSQ